MTRTSRCRWCGRDIIWIWVDGRRTPIEAGWTGYKRVEHPRQSLFTAEGGRILCEILPVTRENEADGWAHIYHFCPKRPIYHKPRPLTRREKYRENM